MWNSQIMQRKIHLPYIIYVKLIILLQNIFSVACDALLYCINITKHCFEYVLTKNNKTRKQYCEDHQSAQKITKRWHKIPWQIHTKINLHICIFHKLHGRSTTIGTPFVSCVLLYHNNSLIIINSALAVKAKRIGIPYV